MTKQEAINKLQQATNPNTPIEYREFIQCANIINCSFVVDSYTKDKQLIYRGVEDTHKGFTTFTSTPNGIEKVKITNGVVYTK